MLNRLYALLALSMVVSPICHGMDDDAELKRALAESQQTYAAFQQYEEDLKAVMAASVMAAPVADQQDQKRAQEQKAAAAARQAREEEDAKLARDLHNLYLQQQADVEKDAKRARQLYAELNGEELAAQEIEGKKAVAEAADQDEDQQDQGKACTICFLPLKTDDVQALPCMHVFHGKCVAPWLAEHTTCPECRYDLAQ